jgi:membrane protein YdbS with pleckstrin-like domain
MEAGTMGGTIDVASRSMLMSESTINRHLGEPALPVAPLPEPRERLDPRAQILWRISGLSQAIVFTGIAGGAMALAHSLFDLGWGRIFGVPVGVAVLGLALAMIVPAINWRQWRYDIHEEEVDIRRGVVTITRQLVPMARIQHVDTRRGPLQRRFGLATVVLYTAAGAIEIPELADPVAASVRDRIAALANVRDDL